MTPKDFYALGMFPYPSGDAHMGHVRVYTIVDAVARFARLGGANPLNPIGWDAFGLPAENAAIARGAPPGEWTDANIDRMRRLEIGPLGFSFDWDREFSTADPAYYRWTQWIFLRMFEAGLAYKALAPVNRCAACETVLANEQVSEGRCWRCDGEVSRREMSQWFLRITDYAQRLWDGLEDLAGWDPRAVAVQRSWIGRSEGARLDFAVEGGGAVPVFTTRCDTLFGAVAVVLAPEHPEVARVLARTPDPAVAAWVERARGRSALERARGEKQGVSTGAMARHPLLARPVPVWIGDYVLADYGTGAVMCVPAHDRRDFDFARAHGLPVIEVVRGPAGEGEAPFTGDGVLADSGPFTGLSSARAREAIADAAEAAGCGAREVQFNLRDWSVGRQRYWGCPIPVVHCPGCGPVGVPDDALPVTLAGDVVFEEGRSRVPAGSPWRRAACPRCGGPAEREVDTLDTFMCSAWYAFRFCDPHNDRAPFDRAAVDALMPVDFYVGGLEHAAQHMLYFRFMTRFLYDRGLVGFEEPVRGFFCNGMVRLGGHKMSKSRGNVVSPTALSRAFGADALKLAVLSSAPPEQDFDWDEAVIRSRARFLRGLERDIGGWLEGAPAAGWRAADPSGLPSARAFYRALHGLEQALAGRRFHNAVARVHELARALREALEGGDPAAARLVRDALVACWPLAPETAEALWARGFAAEGPIAAQGWPEVAVRFLEAPTAKWVVQVSGRKRAVIALPAGSGEPAALAAALAEPAVALAINGRPVRRVIAVQDRLINLVV